ncbi:hypothetical protein CARUB_v10027612mg [Capsella rubella]|uniref:F-box domain-containing protein n=1 Tax=Capsella rubella TaxID=81985 RepID=R0EYQ1_9BRAS|nr:putative FBD-associated F-box protein At5g53635 [Capsella rubella]EOA14412.1 hypothetical protein CARUB_v10027612mg [Capsella rubella]
MVGRAEAKQACSKGLSERLKEDRISELPDPLICHILSHLSTKESVKTSVLSTRWRCLWLWLPSLELDFRKFQIPRLISTFVSFCDRFFESNRVLCIHKLKLTIDGSEYVVARDTSNITSWIHAAVKRKIQHLDACYHLYVNPLEMPLSLYTCETLVSLKLDCVLLANTEFVSLPCLKTLSVKDVRYPNSATFERLVSFCPVLEELEITTFVISNATLFRVFSRSLKKLKITQSCWSGVVIDAPLLRFLSINDDLSKSSVVINKLHPDAKLDISTSYGLEFFRGASFSSKRNSIRSFLSQISKVKDVTMCRETIKIIFQYLELQSLPRFDYISRLHATFTNSNFEWLLTFLKSCQNLKSLVLVYYEERRRIILSSRPECFLSSIEFIDIEFLNRGYVSQLKIVRYFLENTPVLKKLTLRFPKYSIQEKSTFKNLLRWTNLSSKYDIDVLDS